MAQVLRGIQMFDHGDRVKFGDGETGTVEHDMGGAVVSIHPDGARGRAPHDAVPVAREGVKLTRRMEDGEEMQVEIYSQGSTHTLYESCGYDDCRERILNLGLGVPRDQVFEVDRFVVEVEGEPVRITVAGLDDSDSCIWCYGCGDFIRHANASPEPDGTFFGCECDDPEADREAMRPMVVEPENKLELRHW